MEETVEKYSYTKGIIFVAALFINIGFKAVFDIFNEYEQIPFVVFSLSFVTLVYLLTVKNKNNDLVLYSTLCYILLVIFSLVSSDIAYGLEKAYLGLLLPLSILVILEKAEWSEKELVRYFMIAILIVCCIAIPFKIKAGFFNRQVSFGLLGPITFGWLNGMTFLMVILKRKKNFKDFLLAIFFFLMVLWTGSKGPLFATFLICLFFTRRIFGKKLKTKILILIFLAAASIFIYKFKEDIRAVDSLISLAENPKEYSQGEGSGSIGSREKLISISLEIFKSNPVTGVGFGGWKVESNTTHKYPHNVVFELLSETGIIGLLLIIFLTIKVYKNGIFGIIGIYGVITLLFSGDFSYFRYALFAFLLGHLFIKKSLNLSKE